MASQEKKTHASRPKDDKPAVTTPDDFPDELGGEFEEIPDRLAANIGTLAGMVCGGGGYFGVSVTDDGGSLRLAIRHGAFALDKRFYAVGKLETALAYCVAKLRDAATDT